jgi:hypothetical protein
MISLCRGPILLLAIHTPVHFVPLEELQGDINSYVLGTFRCPGNTNSDKIVGLNVRLTVVGQTYNAEHQFTAVFYQV